MTPEELTSYFTDVVLYYCSTLGSYHFRQDLTDVCEFAYDIDNNIYITTWLASSPYTEPTYQNLLDITLSTAQTFYTNNYVLPDSVASQQPFVQLTSTQISAIVMTSHYDGQVIFNTTSKRLMFYDHSTTSFKTFSGT